MQLSLYNGRFSLKSEYAANELDNSDIQVYDVCVSNVCVSNVCVLSSDKGIRKYNNKYVVCSRKVIVLIVPITVNELRVVHSI